MKTAKERIIEMLNAGATDVNEIAEKVKCSTSLVYMTRKEMQFDEEVAKLQPAENENARRAVAIVKHKPKLEFVESVQPVQGGGDDDNAEVERLTSRILDLNETCVELVMENIRLKRALEDARNGG